MEVEAVQSILKVYEEASSQQVNYNKSAVVFNANTLQWDTNDVVDCLHVQPVVAHDKYLRLPSIIGRSKREVFNNIRERVWKKISRWKERLLSKAGKEVLLKVVTQAIPTYAMSCFKLPASSCIFLTLALRLIPSVCGFFLILLHIFTIAGAISGCTAASAGSNKWYAAHMVATVLTAILQGSISLLIFTRTAEFLGELKSYVREEDGAMILKLAGGLCVLIFCLEWVALALAFVLRYYAFVEGNTPISRNVKAQEDDHEIKDWQPFHV
ncbi:hypothetical protein F0562_010691 [Nyssa sinensis]|uniref:Uncharacterized protein n=1 Tax=Nyssa sinensis TaxID=561372 RepID=A0A5J5A2P5_9ASTE|nr:hypothetical protein F0562_010691 [Nyssa sinensis]